MFDTVLIANRGEIACRVARTCRRLGLRTVAVYSDADHDALHVTACDEAWHLGPPPARESYLVIDKIIAAAKATGAGAIHPGYGFLSENAAFAERCAKEGIVFIGPPADAIRAMGSKSAAKGIMEQAGVPLVPGYHGDNQDPAFLAEQAVRIGYPVLIKASAGGGGKGMRLVEADYEFDTQLSAAQREARNAFGDDRVLIERYLTRPRHIEVQVFADGHGNVVHLNERDCSVQRRHQKVLEEAPAPGLSDDQRAKMGQAAVDAARAIGYRGAGTVEFIADDAASEFFFMEMNTRLQVEHPVTEMITGQDLVEWQLLVAAGEPLPLAQEAIGIDGHAFEARIYAEDPARDFLPATGTLVHLQTPHENAHVRIDTGVRQGDAVSVYYDPMIAKLIVWDRDRNHALARLRTALAAYRVAGITTNLPFLRRLAAHPAFARAEVHTGFIAEHQEVLLPATADAPPQVLALAALSELERVECAARARAAAGFDPWSPWHAVSGWRLNDDNHHTIRFLDGETVRAVLVHYRPDHYRMEIDDHTLIVRSADGHAVLDGHRVPLNVARIGEELTIFDPSGEYRLKHFDPVAEAMEAETDTGGLTAPMPGTVVAVHVAAGDSVAKGQALIILEAMKMEHTINAPRDGVVKEVRFAVGDSVQDGVDLLVIEADG